MNRRTFLVAAGTGAGALGIGGWIATGRAPTYRVDLTVRTFEYGLTMLGVGREVPETATLLDDLDADAREAIRTAIEDGRYETDDPSDGLLGFFARPAVTPRHVRDGERYYEIDATLPAFVVTLDPVDESDADDPATTDEFVDAISEEGVRRTGPLTALLDTGEYRTYALDPDVRAFVEETEYMERREGVGRLDLRVDDPGGPYDITAHEVDAETVHEDGVVAIDDLDDDARALVEEVADRRRIGLDEVPSSLRETIESESLVRIDDRLYRPSLHRLTDEPIEFDATLLDETIAPGSPARLDLTVTNGGDEPVGIFSGAPGPFGVLRAEDEDDDRLTLWSQAYAESSHVSTVGGVVVGWNDIGIVTELAPGEDASGEYQLRRRTIGLRPGTFVVREWMGIEWIDEQTKDPTSISYPFELVLEVE